MKLQQVRSLIQEMVHGNQQTLDIYRNHIQGPAGRRAYNLMIRSHFAGQDASSYGVYIWSDLITDEIYYIGMAGTIKTNGSYGQHDAQSRLTASRGKHPETGKDIQTNTYIYDFLQRENLDGLRISVYHALQGEAPAYIEAVLLHYHFKNYQRLPKLNNSF